MNGLLEYIPGSTVLHRLNPLTKITVSIIICAAAFICDSPLCLLLLLFAEIAMSFVGHVFKTSFSLLRKLTVLMFLIFILQVLFVQKGSVILPLFLGLNVTDKGVTTALLVALRLLTATMPLCMMLLLTRIGDLSDTLVVRCRVPFKYAFAVTSAISFIPSFSEQMSEIIEAQTARGVKIDTANPFKKLGLIVPLCVPMLISCVRKTDLRAMAAELRGFNLRDRFCCSHVPGFSRADLVALIITTAAAAAVIIL